MFAITNNATDYFIQVDENQKIVEVNQKQHS